MIYNHKKIGEPTVGKLLISEPFLGDTTFRRSVIMLTEHDEHGSVGFILNRTLDISIGEVLDVQTLLDIPLYLGGPVQNNTLHFLHRDEKLASSSKYLGKGIYWGGDFDKVLEMLSSNTLEAEKYRFFLGYSGWTQGQLANEMQTNSWIVASSAQDIVFESDNDRMWRNILQKMGGSFKILSNSPESPQLN